MKLLVTVPFSGTDNGFLNADTKRMLEENFDVKYNEKDRHYTEDELALEIADADIVITGWGTKPIRNCIDKAEKLKLVAHLAGSVADLVDDTVFDRGVRVISGNAMFAESVAEGTLAYMMSILRMIPDDVMNMRRGHWRDVPARDSEGLFDRTVGIVGYGTISKDLMRMMKPFRVKFKIYSAHKIDEDFLNEVNGSVATLDEIFSTCSIVSLHSSLNERTVGMIRGRHFELMRDGSVFINTARGAIINEKEMKEVLSRRDIRAFLDVFAEEPLDKDDPLRLMPNVYIAPHKAGPTVDRRKYIGRAICEDVISFKNGGEMKLELSRSYANRMTRSIK